MADNDERAGRAFDVWSSDVSTLLDSRLPKSAKHVGCGFATARCSRAALYPFDGLCTYSNGEEEWCSKLRLPRNPRNFRLRSRWYSTTCFQSGASLFPQDLLYIFKTGRRSNVIARGLIPRVARIRHRAFSRTRSPIYSGHGCTCTSSIGHPGTTYETPLVDSHFWSAGASYTRPSDARTGVTICIASHSVMRHEPSCSMGAQRARSETCDILRKRERAMRIDSMWHKISFLWATAEGRPSDVVGVLALM